MKNLVVWIIFLSSPMITSAEISDGNHVITVDAPIEYGFSQFDDIGINVTSPSKPEPGKKYPVIGSAQGQGPFNGLNCSPFHNFNNVILPQELADEGYIVVSLSYRNIGKQAPWAPNQKMRDHFLLDAKALLAAVHYVVNNHYLAKNEVGLVGTSMGAWVALWASRERPELEDLQRLLNIKTVVLTAESGFHPANDAKAYDKLNSEKLSDKVQGLLGMIRIGVDRLAVKNRLFDINEKIFTNSNFATEFSLGYTQNSVDLYKSVYLNRSNISLSGCKNPFIPPACNNQCALSTVIDFAQKRSLTAEQASDLNYWFNSQSLQYFQLWEQYKDLINQENLFGNFDNAIFQGALEGSAAVFEVDASTQEIKYPFIGGRVSHLLSQEEAHYRAESQSFLIEGFAKQNISVNAPIINFDSFGNPCSHGGYFRPDHPECGYQYIVDEFRQVFQ